MAFAISSKGQVTIPAAVRRRLGVKPGDKIDYVVKDGVTTIQPVRDEENVFAEFIGALGLPQPSGHAVAWIRELRGGEEDDDE
jgi:antitoxin PrlF